MRLELQISQQLQNILAGNDSQGISTNCTAVNPLVDHFPSPPSDHPSPESQICTSPISSPTVITTTTTKKKTTTMISSSASPPPQQPQLQPPKLK